MKHCNHPLVEMLKELYAVKIPYDSDPAEIHEDLKAFVIPTVEKSLISKANDLISEGRNEKSILYTILVNFSFDSEKFLKLKSLLKENGPSKSLIIISYSFIMSWIVSTEISHRNFYFDLLEVTDSLENSISPEMFNFIINILTLKYSSEGKEEIPLKILQKYFRKCTKENVYTMVDILDKSIQSEKKEVFNFLLRNMTISFEKNIEQFKSIDFSRLIKIIGPLLYKFDPVVLAMVAVLPKMTKQVELFDSFRELPSQTFLPISETREYHFNPPTIGKLDKFGNECLFSLSFEEKSDDTVEGMIKIPLFDTTLTIQDLILPSHKYVIAAIAPIIVEIPEEYSTPFFESFSDIVVNSSDRFDLYIDYISLVTHPSKAKMTSKIFDGIVSHPVFSSETMFFGNKGDDFIVRSSIVSNFALYNHEALESLLKLLEDTPFMYAEVIGIVSTKLQILKHYSFINHNSIESMMYALDILYKLLDREPKYKTQTQNARKTIFLFIFSILEDQQTAYVCFSSITFATGFFSRVLENQMKDLILQSFSKVLISADIEHKEDLTPSIKFVGTMIIMSKDMRMAEVLQCINNASTINNALPSLFMPLIEPICTYLSNNPSTEFLKQSLEFFLQAYLCIPQFSITQSQMRSISGAIKLLNGPVPNESTVTAILGMLALSRSVYMPSMMILQRPEMILLFISMFRTLESTKNTLLFMYNLCQHSLRNCIICHDGELDLLLLEAIKNYPNPFVFRSLSFELKFEESDIDDLILKMVTLIASQSSSAPVASKFISLATPVANVFPRFAINAFTAISRSLSGISSDPSPTAPLGIAEPENFIHGITGDKVKDGFTVMFWLKVDVPYSQSMNIHPLVFSFLDEGNAAIKVFLTGSSMMLKVFTTRGVSSALLTGTLPSCKWCHITLVYRPEENQTFFDYIFNCASPKSYVISYPRFTDSDLEVKIGGVYDGNCQDTESLSYAVEIGKLTFYDKIFSFKDEISPYCTGIGRKLGSDPIFTFPAESIRKKPTLLDAFISNYRNILPFFSYIGIMPPHFITLLLDILKEMIGASLNVDFCLISHLLKQNNPNILTYSLWHKFCGYFEFLSCNQKLAKDLMVHILVSADLWHNAPPKELLRILNSWPTLINFGIFELVSFRTILSYLRIYFYFNPVETELIIPRNDSSNNKANVQAILNLLRQHEMTEVEMMAIISHCASCPDTEQVISLLSLFTRPTEFLSIPKLLFYLLKPRKEDIFIAVLRALYNLTDDVFPLYVEVIACVLKPFFCTYTLYDKLLELLKEIPLVYPLCAVVALNLGELSQRIPTEEQRLANALESVSVSPKRVKRSQYWIIWLALLAPKLEQKDQLKLISFAGAILLDSFDIDAFEYTLLLIEIISLAKDSDLSYFSTELTKLIIDLIPSNDDQFKLKLFRISTRLLLLHRSSKSISKELTTCFKQSPYYTSSKRKNRASGMFLKNMRQSSVLNFSGFKSSESLILTDYETNENISLNDEITTSQLSFLATSNASILITPQDQLFSSNIEASPLSLNKDITKSQEMLFESPRAPKRCASQNTDNNESSPKTSLNIEPVHRSPQNKKKYKHEQKIGLGIIHDLVDDIKKMPSRKFCFFFERHDNLLNAALEIAETINQLSLLDKTIFDFLQHAKDKVAHPMTQELHISLFNCIDQYISENKNAECFKGTQTRLLTHWNSVENKAVRYSQLITSNVASIASGDVDNQLETINFSLTYKAREGRILKSKVMIKPSPWEEQLEKSSFRKKFTYCGLFNSPLLKNVSQQTAKPGDKQAVKTPCVIVKIDKQEKAVFSLQSEYFSLKKNSMTKIYKYSSIQYILLKCPGQRPTACEVIFESGKTVFLDFAPHSAIDVIQKLSRNAPNAIAQTTTSFASFFKKTGTTQMWIDGEITNYEYLLRLNMFCGRSFRHPALYPIFPWAVIDFCHEKFDIQKEETLRNMKYPITAQTKKQKDNLIEKTNDGECMYFTAPSNPTQVAHWLVRLEPFNTLHIEGEGGHYGFGERLFKSMEKTTHQVLDSANCWECIPEFYCLPEFLFDLNNTGLGDVELPYWAESPFDFVYELRKALECDISSSTLNNWVDLVFGIYLKKDVDEHFNSYCELLQEDVWETKGEDNPDKQLIEVMLSKSGQLPPIVFNDKHPQKVIKQKTDQSKNLNVVSFDRPTITDSVLISSDDLLIYEVIFENGTIETLFIDAENPLNSRGNTIRKLEKIPSVIKKTREGLFLMNDICSGEGKMILPEGSEISFTGIPQFSLLESTRESIIGLTDKGIVMNINSKKELCSVLNERVTQISYSAKFHLILCQTPSDQIIAFSPNDQYLFAIDLKGQTPTKVLITESWGFIVVCCGRKLLLYNVNGLFIRERVIKFDVYKWTTWSDNKGFDHIAICDPNGRVFAFEAFFLSVEGAISHCQMPVTSIDYAKRLSSIVLITRDSRCVFVSYPHK